MKQFGFIGMGNMGYAILKGLLKSKVPDQIIFSARNKEHMEQVAAETGVSYAADNRTCAKESACLVLAVKPQQFDTSSEKSGCSDRGTDHHLYCTGYYHCGPSETIWEKRAALSVLCRIHLLWWERA